MIDTNTLLIILAVIAVLVLAFLIMRPRRQRLAPPPAPADQPYVASRDRPYLREKEGTGVADEVAAAPSDVAGEVLGIDAHEALSRTSEGSDALEQLKGVGPKFAARLRELGIVSFAQLAGLNDAELARLDDRLGPFRGRLARDRVGEQASYLARGDIDGFEERFGKLGS